VTKSPVMGNYHAGFGSGGGVGDRPADHNEADRAIARGNRGSNCICGLVVGRESTLRDPRGGLCASRWCGDLKPCLAL